MNTIIFCRVEDNKNRHNFYALVNDQPVFLFWQKFRSGVDEYFSRGVSLKKAMDFKEAKRNFIIEQTMEKFPKYIAYVEKELGITILEKTKKRKARAAE